MGLSAGVGINREETVDEFAAAFKNNAFSMDGKKNFAHQQNSIDYMDFSTWMDMRRVFALLIALYLVVMNVIIVPTACLCTLFVFVYPFKLFNMSLFNRLEHELCRLVNDSWASAAKFCGLNVIEYGDDIHTIADKRALCIVNHLGLMDHFTLMTAFHDKGILAGRYLWVIFNIWRWNPVGAMWTAHGNFFVYGSGVGERKRLEILQQFRDHLTRHYRKYDYGWVVMYPEGSRLFLIQAAEKRYCAKERIEPFKHCTHPRTGAAHTVLQVCSKKLDSSEEPLEYIIDCTLGYHRGVVPHFGRALLGEYPFSEDKPDGSTIAVHYRIHRVKPEWLSDADAFRNWIYEQYKIKDEMLDHFYRTGCFPPTPRNEDIETALMKTTNGKIQLPRPINIPMTRCFMVHAVWLSLFYFHWKFWLSPVLAAFWHLIV